MWRVVQRMQETGQAVSLAIGLAVGGLMPEGVLAQSSSIFPVSADVATVKSDLLLWATALIGVALAIYAFKRVKGLVGR